MHYLDENHEYIENESKVKQWEQYRFCRIKMVSGNMLLSSMLQTHLSDLEYV